MRDEPNLALRALATSTLVWSLSGHVYADENQDQCLEAYAQGQRDRKALGFARAKESFAFCGGSSCPAALHPDCVRWLSEVEAATPKIVFQISSSAGGALDGVSVTIDGGQSRLLDERALAFDPGEHVIVFEHSRHRPLERRFAVSEAETLTLTAVLEPISPRTPAPSRARPAIASAPSEPLVAHDRVPTLMPAFIGAGIGVIGAAGFAYFGFTGRDHDRALGDCTPNCSEQAVEKVKRDYLLANVSLGVGALGLVGAGAWVLLRPSTTASGGAPSARNILEVRLGPISSVIGHF